jgi:hypothetical protein
MDVNGLKLPESFVILYETIKQGASACLSLTGSADAFGHPFEADLELWDQELVARTARLAVDYTVNEEEEFQSLLKIARLTPAQIREAIAMESQRPGHVPLIEDFSKIVWFGRDPAGKPFCFDYRDNPEEPSVIHRGDAYWRRLAPDFDTLIDLYQPVPNPFRPEDGQRWERWENAAATTAQVLQEIRTMRERSHSRWPTT